MVNENDYNNIKFITKSRIKCETNENETENVV